MFAFKMYVVILAAFGLANALRIDSTALSRSKRELKTLCSAELYTAPLSGICAIPKDYWHEALVKKYVAKQKKANLAAAESVCVFNDVYLEKKWVDSKGNLDVKKITTDTSVVAKDADWKKLITNVVNRCSKEATDASKLPLKSGYKTSCKTAPYIFQTCCMSKLYSNCPAKHQKADYMETSTILAGCDHTALVKSPQEIANKALSNLASMGAGKLSQTLKKVKSNAQKIEAALPKDLMDKLNKSVPKGTKLDSINESKLESDLKNNNDPMMLAKKMNIDTNAFSAFGK